MEVCVIQIGVTCAATSYSVRYQRESLDCYSKFPLWYLIRHKSRTGRNQINVFEVKKVVHYHPELRSPCYTLVCSNTYVGGTLSMQIVTSTEMQPFLPLNFHGNKAISSTQSMPVYPMDFISNFFFIFLVHFSVVYKTSLRVVTQKVSCK